ncbi:MAG: hypothetical protein QOK19_1593 [Solirubrobacteraceae bacterium]|nr:hypothetical protein [Solirubrobacterales bacterium]MEA2216032.1 hypothetical protein [Solirubrobacteraceae bacterium]
MWLEDSDDESGVAILLDTTEAPPDVPERQAIQFVWRGSADSGEQALRAAQSAWEARYGPPVRDLSAFVLEIEPSDSGYRG